jgi:hypothetical protein
MKPTAWLKELPPEEGNGMMMTIIEEVAKEWEEPVIPLYSKGAWVGLTDEERRAVWDSCERQTPTTYVKAIEAKLKEKNT